MTATLLSFPPGRRDSAHLRCSGHRVLLIHPGIYDEFRDRGYPPWGIIHVGSACRAAGAEVLVVDLNGDPIRDRIPDLVRSFEPTVVGVTAKMGNGARRLKQVLRRLADVTEAPVGVGGPLVSAFPDPGEPMWEGATTLFWGDGEEAFPKWIADGCPARGVVGPTQVRSLDTVGLPTEWSGLGEYVSDGEWWPGLEVRSLHLSAARGCTRRCTFCYLHQQQRGHSFRVVSPARLLEGCDELNRMWGAEGFYFVDDCLVKPADEQTHELFRMLIARGSPYRFGCDLQLHELEDLRFLEEMHAAGFRSLYVGVEAVSQVVRRRLGKGPISSELPALLGRATDLGFVIRASIGIGWPGESELEMHETLELIRDLPDLMFDAFRYTPLPNVPLTAYWARQRRGRDSEPRRGPSPFEDYSQFSENYSGLPDETMDSLWSEMRSLESERHNRYFARLERQRRKEEPTSWKGVSEGERAYARRGSTDFG